MGVLSVSRFLRDSGGSDDAKLKDYIKPVVYSSYRRQLQGMYAHAKRPGEITSILFQKFYDKKLAK